MKLLGTQEMQRMVKSKKDPGNIHDDPEKKRKTMIDPHSKTFLEGFLRVRGKVWEHQFLLCRLNQPIWTWNPPAVQEQIAI